MLDAVAVLRHSRTLRFAKPGRHQPVLQVSQRHRGHAEALHVVLTRFLYHHQSLASILIINQTILDTRPTRPIFSGTAHVNVLYLASPQPL